MSDSENLEQQQEQSEKQPDDPIVLLCNRLGQIEAALGIGICEASPSSLTHRLGAIEQAIAKPERERNLPATVTRAQAKDPHFLRRAGIDLKDFASGKIRVVED
jgi:hypothetical protein